MKRTVRNHKLLKFICRFRSSRGGFFFRFDFFGTHGLARQRCMLADKRCIVPPDAFTETTAARLDGREARFVG